MGAKLFDVLNGGCTQDKYDAHLAVDTASDKIW